MLTQIRNALLEMVREEEPELFLSWDDDILFQPNAIASMFEVSKPDNAIGALIDMGGNDTQMHFPSVMHFPQAPGELTFRRPFESYNWSGPFKVDVIMAVKLMGKEVYQNTQYRWDSVGEDIGWCFSCEDLGYERIIQPATRGIHMYDKRTAVDVMNTYPNSSYPELIYPLSRWWLPKDQWKLNAD